MVGVDMNKHFAMIQLEYYISKALTQQSKCTNGIMRQQTGRWHRWQNKFGKAWQQMKLALRLIISYFDWIWQHTRLDTTAAQRAALASSPWTWHDFATYPTLC